MLYGDALQLLRPGGPWVAYDDENRWEWNGAPEDAPTILEVENKVAELQAEEPMNLLRFQRNILLQETDWWAVGDRTMTPEQTAYRQALRDLPLTATPVIDSDTPFGISGVTWPTKP